MANWSNPSLTSSYSDFLTQLKARDEDAASMADSPTNPPTGYKRWNDTSKIFQNWSGSAWADLVLGLTGGGTGSASASGARTNLGLGTMATQNANAVAISGGTVQGLSADITLAADNTYNLGSNTNKVKSGYFKTGLVLPVGTDKYITS